MELYLVRHGKTLWNAENRLQGRSDIELNEEGISAAQELGEKLKDIPFDMIFSSPLKRAYRTAELIRGNREIEIIKDDRLMELSFGICDGIYYKDWTAENCPYRFFFTEPDKYFPPEKGESLKECCDRTKGFIQNVIEPLAEKQIQRVMIVAHGALNASIMCYLEKRDQKHFWGNGLQKNCEERIFSFNGSIWTAN
ncbi:MAG: histidine phosphatase family protein [Treponema sp.]|nr:histidine phosphatase family protein [Treponema sp.]